MGVGVLAFWILFLLDGSCDAAARVELSELHIGGIFPIAGKGGWQGGQACMPAARLALEDVNDRKNLLPGFQLTLHSNDSEVSVRLCTCSRAIKSAQTVIQLKY